MNYRENVISYLQANNILALKLDHALTGVRHAVSNQIDMISAGAKRAIYYTSCFTDEYQDVCAKQLNEDTRLRNAIINFIKNGNIIYEMLKIYFDEAFKYKTHHQIDAIKKMLMSVNIHIAASNLTNTGFSLATASAVAMGLNLNLSVSALIGKSTGGVVQVLGIYGVFQKAAESAARLRYQYPAYYALLYSQELEMMYFLIEPLFERANAYNVASASEKDLVEIIKKMIR